MLVEKVINVTEFKLSDWLVKKRFTGKEQRHYNKKNLTLMSFKFSMNSLV